MKVGQGIKGFNWKVLKTLHERCVFFTMNVRNADYYKSIMVNVADMLKRFGGKTAYYAAVDSLQFLDYSKV